MAKVASAEDREQPEVVWRAFVHDDDQWLSINDGTHGDTLLSLKGMGWRDVQSVKDFAEWVNGDCMHCEECGEQCAATPLGICASCQQAEDRERAGL